MRRRATFADTFSLPGNKLWAFILGSALVLGVIASYFLFESLLPLFMAFGLAYAFGPSVDWAEGRGIPRAAAAFLLILGLCAVTGLLLAYLLPLLMAEGREFSETFPAQVTDLAGKFTRYFNSQGMDLPVDRELAKRMGEWSSGIWSSALASGFGSGGRIFASLSGVMGIGVGLLIVPVFFFYLLRDLPAVKRQGLDLIPPRHQRAVISALRKVDGVFTGYIRGQLTVALLLSVVFAVGLSLIGVRYGLVIGILSGFLNLVPYLGQGVGVLLSLLMVLAEFTTWGRVLAVPLLFSAVNYVEGTFITPRFVGGKVGLSSLQTLVVLFLGADIAGLIGIIVAIPVAASFKLLLLDMFQEYKKSRFYVQGAP